MRRYLVVLFFLVSTRVSFGLESLQRDLAAALAEGRHGVTLKGKNGREFIVHGLAPSHVRYLTYQRPTHQGKKRHTGSTTGVRLKHRPDTALLETRAAGKASWELNFDPTLGQANVPVTAPSASGCTIGCALANLATLAGLRKSPAQTVQTVSPAVSLPSNNGKKGPHLKGFKDGKGSNNVQFDVSGTLGEPGSQGEAYLATEKGTHKTVVLKVS